MAPPPPPSRALARARAPAPSLSLSLCAPLRPNTPPRALALCSPFEYKTGGPYPSHIQTYDIQSSDVYEAVQLRVIDNYGNKDYTCVYRFRVHGSP